MRQLTLPLIAVVACLVACASFDRAAYNTISTTTTAVEAARKAWVDYVTQQRVLIPDPSKRQDLEVKVAKVGFSYGQYQLAMRVAQDAITSYHMASTNQPAVTTAITALSAAGGDLVALIRSFLPTSTAK